MAWLIDRERVLTPEEVAVVLRELKRKAKRSKTTHRNLILFELATMCGLRVSEICGLTLADIRLGVTPTIRVPATIAKGSKARTVPLTWDANTLADVTAWLAIRRAEGAGDASLVLVARSGRQLDRFNARMIYQRACRIIGRKVTIHAGRHTFASLALRAKRKIIAVQVAMGHSSIATTSGYLHLIEPDEAIGNLI